MFNTIGFCFDLSFDFTLPRQLWFEQGTASMDVVIVAINLLTKLKRISGPPRSISFIGFKPFGNPKIPPPYSACGVCQSVKDWAGR